MTAKVDTRPEGGDALAAPFTSGAVAEGHSPNPALSGTLNPMSVSQTQDEGVADKSARAAGPTDLSPASGYSQSSIANALCPGRYAGIGNGGFLVMCHDCELVVEHDWGGSGPGGAPKALREAGWTMFGVTAGARWLCISCGLKLREAMQAEPQ